MGNNLTADQALKMLMAGNARYVTSKCVHPNQTTERRIELRREQNPVATILGCSDSRVPPEVIFDLGLGDLFVVRVAGNVINEVILGSIEYAAAHLHTPLVMVLGHSQCGAVSATVAGDDFGDHISKLTALIRPALNSVWGYPGDLVENIARANAKMSSEQLRQSSPILSNLVNKGSLAIVSAFYSLNSGEVEIIS